MGKGREQFQTKSSDKMMDMVESRIQLLLLMMMMMPQVQLQNRCVYIVWLLYL